MLPVWMDVSNMQSPKFTGVAVYVHALIQALKTFPEVQLHGHYRISRLKYRKALQVNSGLPLINEWEALFHHKKHIFHGPDFWVPASSASRATVVTIHDLSLFDQRFWPSNRSLYGQSKIRQVLIQYNPKAVICVSDFVKQEVIANFPQIAHKVHTVYHGADHLDTLPLVKEYPISLKKPYIMYVGTIEHRKNISNLIQAYLDSTMHNEADLILVGGAHGFGGTEILQKFSKELAMGKIKYLGYVSNHEKSHLLKHASFVVYPSLYEGFGFPILEAMKAGRPVLTSDFGAMKEIANKAAYLSDTRQIDVLSHDLDRLFFDQNLQQSLAQAGRIHAAQFTWKQCARQTIDIYNKLWHD